MLKSAKVVSQRHCDETEPDFINGVVLHHLKNRGTVDPFWISLNADVMKPSEFKSNSRDASNTDEGVRLSFISHFLKRFGSHATGMDLAEVNFYSTQSGWRHADQQTFRELIELVLHEVNQTDHKERKLN